MLGEQYYYIAEKRLADFPNKAAARVRLLPASP